MVTTFFRFNQPYLLLVGLVAVLAAWLLRYFFHKQVIYRYSLGSVLKAAGFMRRHPYALILQLIRYALFALLILIIAQPQLVDVHSKTHIDGIDIMLVLDISGSMQGVDSQDDPRSRIAIAKEEALRFVDKRTNDAIGLVLFAREAFSRCPVTQDKKMVKEMISQVQIGLINADQTSLSTALVTAANRLKSSHASSKIIILLTDGAPTITDIDPNIAISVARELGIRIYTIGVGGDSPVYYMPGYGMVLNQDIDAALMQRIAKETGGRFFNARNAKDMRAVYDTIDQLEKTKHDVEHFSRSKDIFEPLAYGALILLLILLFLSQVWWFSL